jgi:hypothetical protein
MATKAEVIVALGYPLDELPRELAKARVCYHGHSTNPRCFNRSLWDKETHCHCPVVGKDSPWRVLECSRQVLCEWLAEGGD